MRSLAEPNVDDTAFFDAIAQAKRPPRRARLARIRDVVLQAYNDYAAAAPNLDGLTAPAIDTAGTDVLRHGFDVETVPIRRLRTVLTAPIAATRCPLCGLSEAATLDHYLPKELHPVYSFYSKNLVPSCGQCNSRKSTKILDDATGVRRFLHPYFDMIPDMPFVRVSVKGHPTLIIVRYELEQPTGMDDETFTHLSSHFEELDLARRYRTNALLQMSEDRHAFKRWFDKDRSGARLSAELDLKADDRETDYGPNDWLCVLYRALSSDDAFCSGGHAALKAIN